MVFSIAIDGPVGAGKSSVADEAAKRLGILHLDTGAMYRAFAWRAIKDGVSMEDADALCGLAQRMLPEIRFVDGAQRTLIGGEDVTDLIRAPDISMAASMVSKVAGVRRAMVARQQALAKEQSMLLDGRDIGTRVLPHATLKIYLTATPEARAKRRFEELQAKGAASTYDEVLRDVILRDEQDMTRAVDPLRPAQDAQLLDTSELTQVQAVEEVVRRARMKLGKKPAAEEPLTVVYRLARGLSWLVFQTLMPVTYHCEENMQLDAPFILIANHSHFLDPLIVGWKCYRYQIRYLGKKELVQKPIGKWLYEHTRMIAVDRHNMDMSAMRACLKVLKEGHPLGIFPEGTRHKQSLMEDMESGIAVIALRSRVKLLPVYVAGKPRFFHRLHVYFGQPISTTAIAERGINKESCSELLDLITQTYRDMADAHTVAQAEKAPTA
ncbi:MAG: (d)CMP kinase [Clostridia bacterium]